MATLAMSRKPFSPPIDAINKRLPIIQNALPEGVVIEAFYDQASLVDKAVGTVTKVQKMLNSNVQRILLKLHTKIDHHSKNPKKILIPLFCFYGNCGKVCLTNYVFFLAYLVPLDVDVVPNKLD
jgi:hypothetical protein